MEHVRVMDPRQDAELARRVYARSWPTTCRDDFSPDEVITRLGTRDLVWWEHKLAASPVRLAAGSTFGGCGFALAEQVADGWDFSYLFCEPETFGSGLAGGLHDAVLDALRPVTGLVGGWVLHGNARSQAFLARRGWQNRGEQSPPWESTARFCRFELLL